MCPLDTAPPQWVKSIRILQALTTAEAHGTELMTLRLVKGLMARGFACEVSFLDGLGPVANSFQNLGIPVHDLRGNGAGLLRLIQLLARRRYDIVHLYGFRMSIIGRIAARLVQRRPHVVHGIRGRHLTESEDPFSWKARVAIKIERIMTGLIDSYIANSESAVTFLKDQGFHSDKIIYIPNGIDINGWMEPNPRAVQDVSMSIVICVAKFRQGKRQQDLVEAVSLLRQRGIILRCQFVGDGPLRRHCEKLSQKLGLEASVDFLGTQAPATVPSLLRQADIFVLPSVSEGMPGSVMEAMAMGLPIVGSDVPGIRELVTNGETGFLVPLRDVPALAGALEVLLKNRSLCQKMGQAGQRRIRSEFSLDTMVRRYEEAYFALAESCSRKPAAALQT